MIEVRYCSRLGNNLFQFAFGHVLAVEAGVPLSAMPLRLFPGTYGCWNGGAPESSLKMEGQLFHLSIPDLVSRAQTQDIIINGWPHRTEYYEPHRSHLRELLKPADGHFTQAGGRDIVLHLRLGDYFSDLHVARFGYPLKALSDVLATIDYEQCLIVTDSPHSAAAHDFAAAHRGVIVGGNIGHDYRTLYHASRLVMSPSTFSWWAAYTGRAEQIWMPSEIGIWRAASDFQLQLDWPHVTTFTAHE